MTGVKNTLESTRPQIQQTKNEKRDKKGKWKKRAAKQKGGAPLNPLSKPIKTEVE